MAHDQDPLPVPAEAKVLEEPPDAFDRLAPALSPRIGLVQMRQPVAVHLVGRTAVEHPVVAFPETPVEQDRQRRAGQGDGHGLAGPAQVGAEYGGESVLASPIAQAGRLATALFREPAIQPPGRLSALVVLAERMGLVHDVGGHGAIFVLPRY